MSPSTSAQPESAASSADRPNGSYFAGEGSDDDRPAYLGIVPIHVNLTAAMGHAHVALLVTPWSYTTYRGS